MFCVKWDFQQWCSPPVWPPQVHILYSDLFIQGSASNTNLLAVTEWVQLYSVHAFHQYFTVNVDYELHSDLKSVDLDCWLHHCVKTQAGRKSVVISRQRCQGCKKQWKTVEVDCVTEVMHVSAAWYGKLLCVSLS